MIKLLFLFTTACSLVCFLLICLLVRELREQKEAQRNNFRAITKAFIIYGKALDDNGIIINGFKEALEDTKIIIQ